MNKPNNIFTLPRSLLESFLWDFDLEYDASERSKATIINDLTNDWCSANNKVIVKNSWEKVTQENFQARVKMQIINLENELSSLKKFLD